MLPERRADSGAVQEDPEQCLCIDTGHQGGAQGFHDVIIVDMAGETSPEVAREDMCNLKLELPTSLLAGMSRRQTDLESQRRECKTRFRNSQTGSCTYCGRNIVHDMARHVSNYHLDLAQLWQCPMLWCTQWKGTSQDCIDQIHRESGYVFVYNEPLIPFPDAVFLHTDQTLLLDLTQSCNDRIPTHELVALVSPPPVFLYNTRRGRLMRRLSRRPPATIC